MAFTGQSESEYHDLLERARADPAVRGVVLTGSRGRGAFVRADSDWDVRLFVDDPRGSRESYATPHGSVVETVVLSLAELDALADASSTLAWDRYSYVHATVALDNTGGEFERSIARLGALPADAARTTAGYNLDGYINSYYRSLKNDRAGLGVESHLDASESIPPLLIALFAMHKRVRPFNRFLGWELDNYPLPGDLWSASRLLPRLEAIQATGAVRQQASLFRDVESLARNAGHADVIDSWEPDVPWLRSGRPAS